MVKPRKRQLGPSWGCRGLGTSRIRGGGDCKKGISLRGGNQRNGLPCSGKRATENTKTRWGGVFGVFPNMCSCSRGKSLLEQNGEVFLPGPSPLPPSLPPVRREKASGKAACYPFPPSATSVGGRNNTGAGRIWDARAATPGKRASDSSVLAGPSEGGLRRCASPCRGQGGGKAPDAPLSISSR